MDKILAVIAIGLGAIALVFGLSVLLAFPTMWLVNFVFWPPFIGTVFGVAKLTLWKAWGLNFLMGLLFGKAKGTSKS